MTKQQEAALLDQTIERFGQDSYIGPWLAYSRFEILATIHCDIDPKPMLPAEAYRHAERIIADAKEQAARIIDDARKQAEKTKADTERELTRWRQTVRSDIRRALSAVEY